MLTCLIMQIPSDNSRAQFKFSASMFYEIHNTLNPGLFKEEIPMCRLPLFSTVFGVDDLCISFPLVFSTLRVPCRLWGKDKNQGKGTKETRPGERECSVYFLKSTLHRFFTPSEVE